MPHPVRQDFYLLALHRLLFNNPKRLLDHLSSKGDASKILASTPELSDQVTPALEQAVLRDLEWLDHEQHHLIDWRDNDYPVLLRTIHDPPPLLFAIGDRAALGRGKASVAMVGARRASKYGLSQAERMAEDLASAGLTIVSGMALGIDAAAHDGALKGGGITIAVLGTGCDVIYPRRHWRLAQQICADGLIVSEFPLGTEARPYNFPRRNRIVTGVSWATLVIEAAPGSGSLVSARLALAEGRDVMAMPGQVSHRGATGCHQLIRDGAVLIERADHVLQELGLLDEGPQLSLEPARDLTPQEQALLMCLATQSMSIDELMDQLAVPIDELTVSLISLEVLGLVLSDCGIYHCR